MAQEYIQRLNLEVVTEGDQRLDVPATLKALQIAGMSARSLSIICPEFMACQAAPDFIENTIGQTVIYDAVVICDKDDCPEPELFQ